jgi:hypothetical protein
MMLWGRCRRAELSASKPEARPKAAAAARVSAASALLDRGYGKPPHRVTGEVAASYVVRLPEPAKSAEEWIASLEDAPHRPMLSAPVCRKDDDKADKVNDINLAAVTPPSVNSVRVNFSRDTIPAAPKRVPSETPRVAKMKPGVIVARPSSPVTPESMD